MKRLGLTLLIVILTSLNSFAEEFDVLSPANPIFAQPVQNNSVSLSVKKATLTHNNVHNLYTLAFDRFTRSNIKSAYGDFKILIETMTPNDYAYMNLAKNMAEIGFFDLSDLSASKIEDKSLSEFLTGDIKLWYAPSTKIKSEDELYLAEIFSNIIYNDQSKEATSELVKDTELLEKYDYANYIAALGYLKSNEFVDAEKYINIAIRKNPQNLNYKKLKAEILSQSKKPQNALKITEYIKSQKLYTLDFNNKVESMEHYILYKSQKNYSEKMYHLGYYYYYENEPAKAIRTLQNALSSKKKLNKDVYAILSRVYFDTQDYEKAADAASKSDKLGGNMTAFIVLGDLASKDKDYKAAMKYYKKADANAKNSYLPQLKIAQTYEDMENSKKAYEIYEKLLKTYDNCYVAYYKTALKDKKRQIALLKKAISINMNYKDAWIDLARAEIEANSFAVAKQYLKIAGYIDENDYRYNYYQGILAKKQGLDGKSYFEKTLKLNPDYLPAKEELKI